MPWRKPPVRQERQDIRRVYVSPEFVSDVACCIMSPTESLSGIIQSFQQVKDIVKETTTQATNGVLDKFTTTVEQAKSSLQETWQATGQIKDTTSVAIQTAVSDSMSNWLLQHPTLLRLAEIIGWGANHPIISLIILLFVLAIFWSIIKAIGRLIESASLSVVRVPLKLLQSLLKTGFLSFTNLSALAIKQLTGEKLTLPPASSLAVDKHRQQRLKEISQRLAQIHQEQNQLLKEIAEILNSKN